MKKNEFFFSIPLRAEKKTDDIQIIKQMLIHPLLSPCCSCKKKQFKKNLCVIFFLLSLFFFVPNRSCVCVLKRLVLID